MCTGIVALLTSRLPFYLFIYLFSWCDGNTVQTALVVETCVCCSVWEVCWLATHFGKSFAWQRSNPEETSHFLTSTSCFGLYLFVSKMKNRKNFCFMAPTIKRIHQPAACGVAQWFGRFKSGVGFNSRNLYEIWFHAWQVVHAARMITLS